MKLFPPGKKKHRLVFFCFVLTGAPFFASPKYVLLLLHFLHARHVSVIFAFSRTSWYSYPTPDLFAIHYRTDNTVLPFLCARWENASESNFANTDRPGLSVATVGKRSRRKRRTSGTIRRGCSTTRPGKRRN